MTAHPRNPYLTVDVVVEVGDGVVLIERGNEPLGWALPGGFVDYGEDPADAARREVLEETGLEVELLELLGTYGDPGRDPRQHNVSIVFVGRAEGQPIGGDDAARAGVFTRGELPSPLCFDHDRILADYAWLRETGERPPPAPGIAGDVLLSAARDALGAHVGQRPPSPSAAERAPFARALSASFVTLRAPDGSLRGCIGEMTARRALIDSIRSNAVAAGSRDPRFAPVRVEEVEGLHIGISVLTPTRPIRDPASVVVGRHGLLLERGARRGVLLPEVATDHRMDREAFLAAVCRKAGLPPGAWRDVETKLAVFETLKFE